MPRLFYPPLVEPGVLLSLKAAKILPAARKAVGGNLPFAYEPFLLLQLLLHKKCISLPAFAFIIADWKMHVKYNLINI